MDFFDSITPATPGIKTILKMQKLDFLISWAPILITWAPTSGIWT